MRGGSRGLAAAGSDGCHAGGYFAETSVPPSALPRLPAREKPAVWGWSCARGLRRWRPPGRSEVGEGGKRGRPGPPDLAAVLVLWPAAAASSPIPASPSSSAAASDVVITGVFFMVGDAAARGQRPALGRHRRRGRRRRILAGLPAGRRVPPAFPRLSTLGLIRGDYVNLLLGVRGNWCKILRYGRIPPPPRIVAAPAGHRRPLVGLGRRGRRPGERSVGSGGTRGALRHDGRRELDEQHELEDVRAAR